MGRGAPVSFISPWCCSFSLFFWQTHTWGQRGSWLEADLSAHSYKPADAYEAGPEGHGSHGYQLLTQGSSHASRSRG